MRRKFLVLFSVFAFMSIALIAPAKAAIRNDDSQHFKTLPPDLSTDYLQGHYDHKDPKHPNANYAHRALSTATNHNTEKFKGKTETIPAGEYCPFEVKLQEYGTLGHWTWLDAAGNRVHEVAYPDLRSNLSANGKSLWTIDEGWDYFWPNADGTEYIEGTGTHMWVHDDVHRFRMYGTWHLLVKNQESLEYVKLIRDKTSIWDGSKIDDIRVKTCEFLAP